MRFYLLGNKPDIFNSRTREAETDESVGSPLAWSTQQILPQPGTFYPSRETLARREGVGGERRGDEKVERSGEELVFNFFMHCKAKYNGLPCGSGDILSFICILNTSRMFNSVCFSASNCECILKAMSISGKNV